MGQLSDIEIAQKADMRPITEIAEHLSFSSLHAFGIAFKRYMKMSPSEYRNNLKAEGQK